MANETRGPHRGTAWLAATLLSACPARAAQNGSVVESALLFFTRHDAARIVERFDSIRPAAVSAPEKEDVLATLPLEGDVRDLDVTQREKLAAARRVLELHGREAVYVLKVIDVPQAAVALHGRAVVLVSEPALDLLEADELRALVAHEVGHEYFWSDYFSARREGDRHRLQTLELLCDGVAIVTLRRSGTDAARLTSALEKIARYNRDRLGAARNEDHYPAIADRRRFAKRLLEWLGGAVGGAGVRTPTSSTPWAQVLFSFPERGSTARPSDSKASTPSSGSFRVSRSAPCRRPSRPATRSSTVPTCTVFVRPSANGTLSRGGDFAMPSRRASSSGSTVCVAPVSTSIRSLAVLFQDSSASTKT